MDALKIWYIHGANASPMSFSFIKQNTRAHRYEDISYSHDVPLVDTVNDLRRCAALESGPLAIVGHSLGGVIACAVAQGGPVKKVATLSSPFGGSNAASLLRWFTRSQLMADITPTSSVMTSLRLKPPQIPILSVVTDPNIDTMGERGDGVVTVASQMALIGPVYQIENLNHFEVLLSSRVAADIDRFIWGETG